MSRESVQVFRNIAMALAACALATLAVLPFRAVLLDANLALYYLLIVVWLTVKVGRSAGFAGSVLAVLFFDVFLVPPYDSLTVHNPQHALTFAMLLVVSLVTSKLVDGLKAQTALAQEREKLSESLRAMGDCLLSAGNAEDVRAIGEQFVGSQFDAKVRILPPGLAFERDADARLTVGMRKIAGAMLRQRPGAAQAPVTSAGVAYFTLQAGEHISGVMLLLIPGRSTRLTDAQERWVQTASVQLALALDRVRSSGLASQAQLAEKNERFRNAILSSISHDIRTPLTTVVGLAERLTQDHGGAGTGTDADTAAQLHRAALRMNATVTNLLDIARFSQHGIAINADWTSIDEVIGSAIQLQRDHAPALEIRSEVRGEAVLLRLDALLIEKVLCNLIDNAIRHATGATLIAVRARFRPDALMVSVIDNGCGIGHRLHIANVLDPAADSIRDHGGLGLSICRAICDAHGARLRIFGRPGQGCCAVFSVPLMDTMPFELDDDNAG